MKKQWIETKWLKRSLLLALCLALLCGVGALGVNQYVKGSTKDQIITADTATTHTDFDCILVLGCGVKEDGSPTLMLKERMDCGIALYQTKAAPKLLLSGDNGQVEYNEVETMRRLAAEQGIPAPDIFLDHAGFSTYESIYRAKEIFQAKKVLIVTQEYHLYRALYIANQLDLKAYGVACDTTTYYGQTLRDIREILARNKDALKCIFKPEPTFLGEAIPVSGNGETTH